MRVLRGTLLAALAAAALTILPATASASGGIAATSHPATLHGGQATVIKITAGSSQWLCGAGVLNGQDLSFETTLNQPLPSVSSGSFTKETKCNNANVIQTVKMNGCQLEFHPGAGTVGIGPSKCGPVSVSGVGCGTVQISAQSLSATYTNVGSGSEARIEVAISDNSVEYVSPGGWCGTAGTHNDMIINGTVKLTATTGAGSPVGVSTITGDLPSGIFLIDEESGPQLESTLYPVKVSGERLSTGKIVLLKKGGYKVSCNVANLDGGVLNEPLVGGFALNATYSDCTAGALGKATVAMGSCHYEYSEIEEVMGTFNADAAIVCNPGDVITISAGGCTVKVPGQSLNTQAGMADVFNLEIWETALSINRSATNVSYSNSGTNCVLIGFPKEGSGSDATLESQELLHGVYAG